MRRLLTAVMLLTACGSDDGGGDADGGGDGTPTGNGEVFDPAVTTVSIEVDYETGNAPYTGNVVGFGDTFDPTLTNVDRLFSGTKTLDIPVVEAEMEDIGVVADEELTVDDLLALAAQHRTTTSSATTAAYYLMFVSGYFTNAEGPQPGVIGVSIGDTRVIAMFKDVIRSTSSLTFPNLERYVEQSTFIHELAHAFGLTNNGVPMVAAHQDTAHGAHCTNDRCVMYWLNEGAEDAAQFAQQYVLGGDSILFDEQCLADVDALTR